MKHIDYLKKVPLFEEFSKEDLKRIAELLVTRFYPRGSLLFQEGQPGDGLYIVLAGSVRIFKQDKDGREQVLHILGTGEIFAEVVLLDGGSFPASAEALEDSYVGVLLNKDMDRLLKDNPELLLNLLKIMVRRLREAQERLRDMASKDARRRAAGILVDLAAKHGKASSQGVMVNLPITHQELANIAGVTRETINRVLNDMQRQGILGLRRKAILIRDMARLKEIAE